MLRITTEQREDIVRLELHGVLGGAWVALLDLHWRSLLAARPSARVTLVLSDVEFIDPDGERLLAVMAESGVDFVVTGTWNRYVIEKLQARQHHVPTQ